MCRVTCLAYLAVAKHDVGVALLHQPHLPPPAPPPPAHTRASHTRTPAGRHGPCRRRSVPCGSRGRAACGSAPYRTLQHAAAAPHVSESLREGTQPLVRPLGVRRHGAHGPGSRSPHRMLQHVSVSLCPAASGPGSRRPARALLSPSRPPRAATCPALPGRPAAAPAAGAGPSPSSAPGRVLGRPRPVLVHYRELSHDRRGRTQTSPVTRPRQPQPLHTHTHTHGPAPVRRDS